MASSMAAAAAHSMPPFPLPAIPRVRPPPIPKGTPGPNTLPQPSGPPRKDLVWADGRWAHPHSRSAKHKQEVVSKQLEKALQHEVHGMNIYAYKHIRTHQVVYSLTKNMDNTKILKQLLYHGKKTVPAALRRDVWRPYFSVHFPRTPAGSLKGLRVFQELRELSALRQLKPPKEMTIATQKDLDDLKKQFDPVAWLEKTENVRPNTALLKPPVVGDRLPRKMLAKRLMNQAATSVADIAAILTRQTNAEGWKDAQKKKTTVVEPAAPTPQQRRNEILERREAKNEVLSIRANNRLAEIRKKEEAKAEQLEQRQRYLAPKPGMVRIDPHTLDRINIEYDGIGQRLTMIEEADQGTREEIGATVALQRALENMEEEKRVQRQEIEKSMAAQIEKRLMKMTEAKRDQIEKEVEAQRAQRQSEIDAQVATTREEFKEQRARLYKQPPSGDRTRALRKLTRDSQAEVYKMKTDLRTRHLKWAGPFASVATAVDEKMAAIDAKWEPVLGQLREQVEAEKQRHADLNNHEVEIRWANIRDGTYAQSWPDTVYHVDLEPKAVNKSQSRVVTTHFHYDADEDAIENQLGSVEIQRRSTVHVFGSAIRDPADNKGATGRYESSSELSNQQWSRRAMRVQEWANSETIIVRDRIIAMRLRLDALKREFAEAQVDEAATPYIAASMSYVEAARDILKDQFESGSYSSSSLKVLDEYLQFIRDYDVYCRDELASSPNPIADQARVQYAMLEADLMALESRNDEARQQAIYRENFMTKFNEREGLEKDIELFKDDERQHAIAVQNLASFDLENPIISGILARRAAALENLPSEIENCEAEIARLDNQLEDKLAATQADPTKKAESKEIRSLRKELKSEGEKLRSKIAELEKLQNEELGGQEVIGQVIRNDKEAWLEFKREKMMSSFSISGGSTRSIPENETSDSKSVGEGVTTAAGGKGMVMEQPEDMKGPVARTAGRFERGARALGLGRLFGK